MDRDQLVQALLATFLEELEEHVASLNRDLLALEKAPAPERGEELLASLQRTVHSVKGASRAVSATIIETACHRLEEVFITLQHGRAATPELYELCFATVDALDDAGRRLAQHQPLEGSPLEALVPRLAEQARAETAPAPAPPGSTAPAHEPTAPPHTENGVEPPGAESLPVRVSAQKLDALLARSGELRVASLRMEGHTEALEALREELAHLRAELSGESEATARRWDARLGQLSRSLATDRLALLQAANGLDEEVRRARTLPFAEACAGLERSARDVARGAGKQVRLEVQGGALELDRGLLQGLREPLLHMVRNTVAHGIESPAERREAGKPEEGLVRLSAALSGGRVRVTVEDDGRGLDLAALRTRARALGIEPPENDAEAARLAFLPGLSTATQVTAVSGRGVGLDVVRAQVELMRGGVDVTSRPGQGTRFVLDVPLTLSTLRVLLVEAGGQTFAVEGESVARLLRLAPSEVREVEGRPTWVAGNALVPLDSLSSVLGLPEGPPRARRHAMVLAVGGARAALVVDEISAEQEVLIRGLGPRMRRVRHVSGAAVLPDGRLALLLNAASLVRAAEGRPTAPLFPAREAKQARKRVVLADDSMTTRALEQSILESAGFEVVACADGAEAWEKLQRLGADALVSDVEMPRMDGFALTEAVRASPRFGRLPIILVTAKERTEDRQRGLEVGASAYLVKSAFEQTHLLDTLRRLL
ncbi:response regulator [Myxococcaceae bacterium GXIMD 01537]